MALIGSDFDLIKWNKAFAKTPRTPADPYELRMVYCRKISRLLGILIAAFGLLVMISWWADKPELYGWNLSYVSMKFNTALCLLVLGSALFASTSAPQRSRGLIVSLCLLSGIMSFLTLLEYNFGVNLGLDQLFIEDYSKANWTSSPGRMAATTAFSILLLSLTLPLPARKILGKLRIMASLTVFLIAFINFCGYIFSVASLYQVANQTAMAWQTSFLLILLSLGAALSQPEQQALQFINAETPAGLMLRRMLPAAFMLPFFLGWLRLRGQELGLYSTEIGVITFAVSYSLIFVLLIWRNAILINKTFRQKEAAEKQRDSAEQAAMRQARRVNSIMENIGDAVITINDQGIIKSINQATTLLFGYSSAELLGQSVHILMPQPYRKHSMRSIKRMLPQDRRPRSMFRQELEGLRKDGKTFPIDLVVSEFTFGSDRYFSGVIRDITERKKSQEALRRWEYIFKNAHWAIVVADPKNNSIIDVNPAFAQMHAYSVEELIGKPLDFVLSHEDREKLTGYLAQVDQEGELLYESIHVRKNRSRFAALSHVNAFKDQDGKVLFRAATFQDISARKEAEENLRRLREDLEVRVLERTKRFADEVAERKRIQETLERKEAELLLIANILPAALSYIDRSERFVFCNKTYEKWMGLPQEKIIGRQVKEVVSAAYYETSQPFVQQVMAGQASYFELKLPYSDQVRTVAVNAVPDVNGEGEVRGYVLLSLDISSLMEAQTQLKSAKILADEASRAKSAFLANMSHEIRTPLGAVLGFSELISNPHLSSSERTNYLAAIKRNGEMLSNIINDILDISKVEAGRLEITTETVVVADIVQDTTALLNLQAAEKGIQLSVVAEGPIPQTIHTDPLRLKQILINIAGNAIKFTKKGQVTIKIRQDFTSGVLKLAFVVSDTGPGITSEQAQRLFIPFSQADASTTRNFGGTGLGLALARRLANLLGGDVVLTSSQLASGSTFTITIDPGTLHSRFILHYDNRPLQSTVPLAHIPSEVSLDGLSILLAEDAPDNQMLISHYLKMAGARVEAANNGREACDKVLNGNYDLVLMDLQMPVMDGFEATTELRRSGYRKPILALTAHAMKEDRMQCLSNGFDDHISKPIDRQRLVERIALLGHSSQPH